jgi:hypothetical protein
MRKEIADKWVDSLRSGKYTQGQKYLKQSLGESKLHCCLGVLCEIYNESNEKLNEKLDETYIWDSTNIEIHTFDGLTGSLPSRVMKWSDIRTENASFGYVSYHSLAFLNDTGKSFSEIAQFIETYWRQL